MFNLRYYTDMERFLVRRVGRLIDKDINTDSLVLAESEDGVSGRWLELQRTLEPDEQDRDLGLDTYCLVNEVGATVYGGVARWSLKERVLVLELDDRSASVLRVRSGFELTLARGSIDEEAVRSALDAILG